MSLCKSFFYLCVILISLLSSSFISAQNFWEEANIQGAYRVLNIAGLDGIHLQSLNTKAILKSTIHKKDKGTLSIWVSPLEELTFSKMGNRFTKDDKNYINYTFISDTWPVRNVREMKFGFYWNTGYPQLISRFMHGRFWTLFNYGFAPIGYAEKLTLRPKQWYHLVMTWNKSAGEIKTFANGILIGASTNVKEFQIPNDTLYFGNPMMVFHDIKLTENIMSASEIKTEYLSLRPESNSLADDDLQMDYFYQEKPKLDLVRDSNWEGAYSTSFLKEEHLKEWHIQTGDKYIDSMDIRITDEGLLIQTPNIVAEETRMYLWSPKIFEGNQWIEFDFQVQSEAGLALLVICASGPQRNDFIDEGWMYKTGSMGFILSQTRNYHWEFMRRVEMMRSDMETQYLAKNPWAYKMSYGCIPRLEQNKWYHLQMVKVGNRLHGSIDGITVFDLNDDSFNNNGPVLNGGRIGIRQMYKTKMLYKNFEVYTKP